LEAKCSDLTALNREERDAENEWQGIKIQMKMLTCRKEKLSLQAHTELALKRSDLTALTHDQLMK